MSHENLKAGIHHCGLGGTLEFVNSGVPALTIPHFGDQGMNARNLIERGVALPLFDTKVGDRDADEKNMTLPRVLFDANHVAD